MALYTHSRHPEKNKLMKDIKPTGRYLLVAQSQNAKLGAGVATTYSSKATTCPSTCPLKGNGCYAEGGPTAIAWRRADTGMEWGDHVAAIGKLPKRSKVRLNTAGDLPATDGDAVVIDAKALRTLNAVAKKRGHWVWGYTHKPMTPANVKALAACPALAISASCHTMADADAAMDAGVPAVVVVPENFRSATRATPAGRAVVVCPAQTSPEVTCATCMLCANRDRKCVVAFRVHGTRKKTAAAFAATPHQA
jgi:hypothetical protein